jgi:glutaredoxin
MGDRMSTIDSVDFYWRQGCGFCMNLERKLDRAGIPLAKKNIWDDPAHAAHVRSVANGNETVPTETIGSTSLVNPRLEQVIDALRREAPHLVPEQVDKPGVLGRIRDAF